MKVRHFWSFLLIGACLGSAEDARAQAGSPVGVPVKIWGKATASAYAYLEYSEFIVSGSAMETYPGANDGAINAWGESATPYATYNTAVDTVKLEPNKTYSILENGYNLSTGIELHVVAPPGYAAEIDGVQRPYLAVPYTTTHTYTVRITAAVEISPRAGVASSLAGNKVEWQVSLGSLRNGTGAGSLFIVNAGTGSSWSSLFTPAALDYLANSTEIQVFRDGSGNIKQVLANQAVVNVVTNSSTQYDIFFYHPGQLSGTSYPYTFTGKPYVQYRVEQVSGASFGLQITSYTRNLTGYSDTDTTAPVVRTAVTSIQRSGSSPNFGWTLHDWNTSSTAQLTEQGVSSTGAVTPGASPPTWYDALGNAKNLTGLAARFGELLNKADVLIGSPVAASTAINHFGAFAPLYNPPPHG